MRDYLSTTTLLLTVTFCLTLAGCVGAAAALEGLAPVTDAGMQAAIVEQAESQAKAVQAASEGNSVSAILYSLISGLTGVGIVVGASKRRRALGARAAAAAAGTNPQA